MGMQFVTDTSELSTLFPDYMVGFEKILPSGKGDHPDLDNTVDAAAPEYFSLIQNRWRLPRRGPHPVERGAAGNAVRPLLAREGHWRLSFRFGRPVVPLSWATRTYRRREKGSR